MLAAPSPGESGDAARRWIDRSVGRCLIAAASMRNIEQGTARSTCSRIGRAGSTFRYRTSLASVSPITLIFAAGELRAQKDDFSAAQVLRDRIAALSSRVRADEAQRVAECAYAAAAQLRRDYGVIGGPPSFHNVLVNLGIRKRGLCFQWAEDLLVQLDALKLRTLELHWAEAWGGSWREHNCVVVTANGQPFRQGIILDCWRHSGHLFWSPLATDHYPWIEDHNYATVARGKFFAKQQLVRR
jgi:hypothetical protein